MAAIELSVEQDTLTLTRLDKKEISWSTFSDLAEQAFKECLTYVPDVDEMGESITIKCYTQEDALILCKRIMTDNSKYISVKEEAVEDKKEIKKIESDEEKKEELPAHP